MLYNKNLPQTSIKKQLVDQSAHFIAAFIIIAVFIWMSSPLGGFILGSAIGLVREITENKFSDKPLLSDITSFGSLLDTVFWGIGGMAAVLLFG